MKEKRKVRLVVYVSPEKNILIKALAKEHGVSVSAIINMAITEYSNNHTLPDKNTIQYDLFRKEDS